MAERGMVFYEGKFRTPQDIAIRERNKQNDGYQRRLVQQAATVAGLARQSPPGAQSPKPRR